MYEEFLALCQAAMRKLVILATVVLILPMTAEAGSAGRFLTGLLARGAIRAATTRHQTPNFIPAPKIYSGDILTVKQLAACLNKAKELDRESEIIDARKPTIEAKVSELHRFETALDQRRTYINHTNAAEITEFNASLRRYKQRAEILKQEQQAYNAAVDTLQPKVDFYNASCAKKYYAEDLFEANDLAKAGAAD